MHLHLGLKAEAVGHLSWVTRHTRPVFVEAIFCPHCSGIGKGQGDSIFECFWWMSLCLTVHDCDKRWHTTTLQQSTTYGIFLFSSITLDLFVFSNIFMFFYCFFKSYFSDSDSLIFHRPAPRRVVLVWRWQYHRRLLRQRSLQRRRQVGMGWMKATATLGVSTFKKVF